MSVGHYFTFYWGCLQERFPNFPPSSPTFVELQHEEQAPSGDQANEANEANEVNNYDDDDNVEDDVEDYDNVYDDDDNVEDDRIWGKSKRVWGNTEQATKAVGGHSVII